MRKRILHLGGQANVLASIPEIKAMGVEVFVADLYPDSPGFAIADGWAVVDLADIRGVTAFARRIRADAILAVNEFGVLSASYASQKLGLINLSPRAAIRARDKGLMRDCWRRAGLPQPRYRIARTPGEIERAANAIGYPIILKPAMNCGSRGVSRVENERELPWAIRFAGAELRNSRFIVESFVAGTEMTLEGLVCNGRTRILAKSDKERQIHPRYQVAMALNYPARLEEHHLDAAEELTMKAAEVLGISNGAIHCECMVNEKGVQLIEMAARPGGQAVFNQVVRHVSGISMPQALVKILLGERVELTPLYQRGVCYRFFSPPEGVFLEADGIEEARCMPGIIELRFDIAPGTRITAIESDRGRPASIVAVGATREIARERADRAIARIRYRMSSDEYLSKILPQVSPNIAPWLASGQGSK